MNNTLRPEGFDFNLRKFFKDFADAVKSKDDGKLNPLISDNYSSYSLMNKTKKELVSYITSAVPTTYFFLEFSFDIDFYVEPKRVEEGYEVIIKPQYRYSLFGVLNLAEGIFGKSDKVFVKLERNPDTELYRIVNMEDLSQ